MHNAIVMKIPGAVLLLVCAVPIGLAATFASAADVGAPAPALTLPTAGGNLVTLEALRSKVVYVDLMGRRRVMHTLRMAGRDCAALPAAETTDYTLFIPLA